VGVDEVSVLLSPIPFYFPCFDDRVEETDQRGW
jgi:hypothetical protein